MLLGTVCSYPKFTPVPFREESLWDGYPEETNAPYGLAKKAHLVHAQVNAAQYGQRFAYLIPTNLFGPGDKFHPAVSHVIPALIKKCVEAGERDETKVDVWGTGRASREYLYVDDAAEAIVLAAELDDATPGTVEPINLGTDREVTIRETVETIARLVALRRRAPVGSDEARWPAAPPRRRVESRAGARLAGPHAVRGRPASHHRVVPGQPRGSRARSWPDPSVLGHDAGGDGRCSVGGGQRVDRLVGVQPAGVRDNPQLGVLERLRLSAEGGTRQRERVAIGTDAGDGHDPRTMLARRTRAVGRRRRPTQPQTARRPVASPSPRGW